MILDPGHHLSPARQVAVFGLGSSGLLSSAQALIAGGAEVVAFDDNDDKRGRGAEPPGIATADLRELDWSNDRRAGAGARRAADASGAALDGGARAQGRRRDHRRHRIVLPRARASRRRNCPLVAITGTNGKSTTTALIAHLLESAGRDAQMGGNIGMPVLALEPFARRPRLCARSARPTRSISRLRSMPTRRHPAQRVARTISTATARMENYAAIKERLPAQRRAGRHGGDRRRRRLDARRRRAASRAPARTSCASRCVAPLRDGYLRRRQRASCARSGGKAQPVAQLAGIGSLRGAHNAQNAACAIAACARARPRPAGDPEGPALVSRPRPPHGADRPQGHACCSSTIPRRPMPIPPRRRWRASTTFSGSPAASRRPAASPRSPSSSRASARPI